MLPSSLIAGARDGDAADVDRLIEMIWPQAFRIALSMLSDRSMAQDAAQETCAIVFANIRRLRSIEAFGTWLYRIVMREAMAIERRSRPARIVGELKQAFAADETVLRIDVLAALARLTPIQRACVSLYYYAGLNSREVAAILDIPDSSVRFHIMNAKKHLERLLGDHRERTLSFWETSHLAT